MILSGIDPGKKGALSFINTSTRYVAVEDMPLKDDKVDGVEIFNILNYHHPEKVAIEKVTGSSFGKNRKMGGVSMFNFGASFEAARLASTFYSNVPPKEISPLAWKGYFGLKGKPKDASRLKLLSMISDGTLIIDASFFKRKMDVDRADATLVCLYHALRLGVWR